MLLSYTDGSGRRTAPVNHSIHYKCYQRTYPILLHIQGNRPVYRNINNVPIQDIVRWCLYALLFHVIKIVCFSASTWISHIAAYHILEGLRLRLTDRFLKAPLGDVEGHSIGEIKSIMVEKDREHGTAYCAYDS